MEKSKFLITVILMLLIIVMIFSVGNVFVKEANVSKINAVPSVQDSAIAGIDEIKNKTITDSDYLQENTGNVLSINEDESTIMPYADHLYKVTIKPTKLPVGVKKFECIGASEYLFGETVKLDIEIEPGYEVSWTIKGVSKEDYDEDNDSFIMPANHVTIIVESEKIVDYEIEYILNGGIQNAANPITYSIASEDIILMPPTKEGYEFLGWTGSNGEDPEKEVTIPSGSRGNRTYTANWKGSTQTSYSYIVEHYKQNIEDDGYPETPAEVNEYETLNSTVEPGTKVYEGFTAPEKQTVELDANGTTIIRYEYVRNSYEVIINKGKGIKAAEGAGTYKYGATVYLSFEREDGYSRWGWTMDGIGEEDYDDYTDSFIMPANDVTIEVKATEVRVYDIYYYLNGGTENPEPNPTTYNVESEDIILNPPTREGYEFIGWTGSNGNVPQKEVTIQKGTTGYLVFSANWELIQPTITEYTYEVQHFKENLNGAYNSTPDKTETKTTTEKNVSPDTETYVGFTSPAKRTVELDANKTTIIKYEYPRNSYKIDIKKGNGIQEITGNGQYKYEQEVSVNTVVAQGYENINYNITGIDENTYINGKFTMPANDIVGDISATVRTYQIKYNLNGGTQNNGNPTTYTVESDDIILVPSTKVGYEFLGWTGSNGNVPQKEVTISKGSIGNKEYTANWKLISTEYLYKVEHYKQNIDGSYSNTPDEVENLKEVSDTLPTVSPEPKEYEGFTSPSKQTVELDANKTTIIKYEYPRNSYKVDVKKGNGIQEITGNGQYKYGQEVSVKTVTLHGYENVNYNITGIEVNKYINGKFTMPANDIEGEVSATIRTYQIKYNLNGGTENANPTTYTVESDDIILNPPVKEGYKFLGWTGSNGAVPQKEVTIPKGSIGNKEYTAVWESVILKYTVEHYKQNQYGNYLNIPDEKEEFEANLGTTIRPDTKGYEGFIMPTKQTVELKEDTVIKYYYERNAYEVKIKTKTGISEVISKDKYLYEEKVTLHAIQMIGYDVVTWKIMDNGRTTYYTGNVLYFNMPANDVIIEVQAEKDFNGIFGNDQPVYMSCKIEHYLQNIDGTYPELPIESEIQTVLVGSALSAKTKTFEGFTSPKTEVLRAGVIKYYYTRNSYNLNITKGKGIDSLSEGNTYKYNQEVSLEATLLEGYENIKWIVKTDQEEQTIQENGIMFNMPDKDVNIEVVSTPITYTISYDLKEGEEQTNPTTYTIESEDIKLSNPTKEGYEFIGWTGSNGEEPEKEVVIFKGSIGNKEYMANWKEIGDVPTTPDDDDDTENKDDENDDNNNDDNEGGDNNDNNGNDDNNNSNDDDNNNNNNNGNDNNNENNNNDSGNGNSNNGNNNANDENKNEEQQSSSSNTDENKTNSGNNENLADKVLPKAGREIGMICLIIVAGAFGGISLKRYLKYKDI